MHCTSGNDRKGDSRTGECSCNKDLGKVLVRSSKTLVMTEISKNSKKKIDKRLKTWLDNPENPHKWETYKYNSVFTMKNSDSWSNAKFTFSFQHWKKCVYFTPVYVYMHTYGYRSHFNLGIDRTSENYFLVHNLWNQFY